MNPGKGKNQDYLLPEAELKQQRKELKERLKDISPESRDFVDKARKKK